MTNCEISLRQLIVSLSCRAEDLAYQCGATSPSTIVQPLSLSEIEFGTWDVGVEEEEEMKWKGGCWKREGLIEERGLDPPFVRWVVVTCRQGREQLARNYMNDKCKETSKQETFWVLEYFFQAKDWCHCYQ